MINKSLFKENNLTVEYCHISSQPQLLLCKSTVFNPPNNLSDLWKQTKCNESVLMGFKFTNILLTGI